MLTKSMENLNKSPIKLSLKSTNMLLDKCLKILSLMMTTKVI